MRISPQHTPVKAPHGTKSLTKVLGRRRRTTEAAADITGMQAGKQDADRMEIALARSRPSAARTERRSICLDHTQTQPQRGGLDATSNAGRGAGANPGADRALPKPASSRSNRRGSPGCGRRAASRLPFQRTRPDPPRRQRRQTKSRASTRGGRSLHRTIPPKSRPTNPLSLQFKAAPARS
jgi:hypothetical protein